MGDVTVTKQSITAARSEDNPLAFIGTAELSTKVASGPAAKWSFTLIDARSRVDYEESHIAGAINLPASQTQALLPKRIKDHARQIIFYCNGPKCTKSQKGARAAMALGYSSVLEYNEGLPAWGKANLPVEGTPLPAFEPAARSAADIARDMEKGAAGPFLLDIRDASEFAAFHVGGAVNVALDDIASHVKRLPKGRTIVVMDHSGHQTLVAARLLHHLGFDAGRMSAMETAGRELVAANAQQKWAPAGEASPRFTAAAQQLVEVLDKTGAAQRDFVRASLEEASTRLRRRAVLFGLGLAITIALALVLLWSLQRQLVEPLKVLTSATARIVETGDLKHSVDLRRDDEIGELAASFSQLVEKLRRIPSSLGDASGLLATCVQNLTVTAEQQTRQAAARSGGIDHQRGGTAPGRHPEGHSDRRKLPGLKAGYLDDE